MDNLHERIVLLLFGPGYSNEDVTFSLVRMGTIFMVLQFLISLVRPVPYGRYKDESPKFLTLFNINNRLAWIVQECPAFFFPFIFAIQARNDLCLAQWILLSAFMLHYFQRSFIFPLLMRSNNSSPFLSTLAAVFFCSHNGFLQSHSIIYTTKYSETDLTSPLFIGGLALFLFGFIVNIDSDHRLRLLRSTNESSKAGKSGYKIPYGGLFEYVSAANYFGEICEWAGYALATRNIAALYFAAFSLVFLGMRGLHHHRFYLTKFKEYPRNRRAVIPFIL